jgi:DNA-binding transcriptional LysR family regulator
MQNRRIVDGIFQEAGVEPQPAVETNSISTLIAHVRDGPWSTVMSQAWLHGSEPPPGTRAIPLVRPVTTRTIGLVWLDRDPEPILARALIDLAATQDVEAALSA